MSRTTNCLVRAALAAAACLQLGVGTAEAYKPSVPEGFFGISAPGLSVLARDADPRLALYADGIRDTGVDFVRSTVDWRQVEPFRPTGGAHSYDWGATDRLVRALAERDLELVANLMGTPAWARASDTLLCTQHAAVAEEHAGSFGELAGALVRRYGDGGDFWKANPALTPRPIRRIEIWNEPNWMAFWCPGPQPERFATLAVSAARQIKATDPGVETVLGGLVMSEEDLYFPGGGLRGMESGAFLARMVAAEPELADLLDQIGTHLYNPDPDIQVSLLGWFRGRLENAGLGDAGLLVTEFGWYTAGDDDAISERSRAEAYTDLVDRLARTNCDLRGIALHDWATPETDLGDPEDWFGIADPATGSLHASGKAYRDSVELFEGRGTDPPPRTTIPLCGPVDVAPRLKLRSRIARNGRATIHFSARDDAGRVSTACRIEGKRWHPCGSPFVTRLKPGTTRVVIIRARDEAGNQVVRRIKLRARRQG
jgi:hypothetical protein